MTRQCLVLALITLIACAVPCRAQVVVETEPEINLAATDLRRTTAPPNTASTLVDLTVDRGSAGTDSVLVLTSHAQALVTLLLPDGTELAAGNNQSYTFTTPAEADLLGLDVPLPLGNSGAQTLIAFPASAASGVYRIKINTTGIATPVTVIVMYLSSSQVRLGVSPHALSYKTGDRIIITSFLFNDNLPVAGGSLTGTFRVATDVTSQVMVGGYRQIRRTELPGGEVEYEYSATLLNTGAPLVEAVATLQGSAPTFHVEAPEEYVLGNVPATASVILPSTFVFRLRQDQSFSPSLLKWKVTVPGGETPLTFADSGPNDAAPGDGAYTAVYTAATAGRHTVTVRATGSVNGTPFARWAATEFEVISTSAAITGVQDRPVDANANGRAEALVVDVTVVTNQAGDYTLQGDLQDAQGGRLGEASARQTLAAGSATIPLVFRASPTWPDQQPLRLANFRLLKDAGEDETLVAYSEIAGLTAAYAFEPAALALSGQNSVELVDSNGVPGAETLRFHVGITPPLTLNGVACGWSGRLLPAEPDNSPHLFFSGSPVIRTTITSIPFDADTFAIRAAGLTSPYRLADITINCRTSDSLGRSLYVREPGNILTTPAYSSSELEKGFADFAFRVQPGFLTLAPGSRKYLTSKIERQSGFTGDIALSPSGLPGGVSAVPVNSSLLDLTASPAATPGIHPLLVTATSGSLSHKSSGLLNIADIPASGYRFTTWPAGLQIVADGVTYTAPLTLPWVPGSPHHLALDSPQPLGGLNWEFVGWSDGGPAVRSIVAGAQPAHLAAYFRAEVTSRVQITSTGFDYSGVTGQYSGTYTVKNTGTESLDGPLHVVLTGLPAGVTLVNATGNHQGAPYFDVPVTSLAPGASATWTARYLNPANTLITATARTYLGVF